ncbi:MAG: hypothetical protein WCX71_03390 [Candidatus Buchananbacteria bacterium]
MPAEKFDSESELKNQVKTSRDDITDFEKKLQEKQRARELYQMQQTERRQQAQQSENEKLSPEQQKAKAHAQGAPMKVSASYAGGSADLSPTQTGDKKAGPIKSQESSSDQENKPAQSEQPAPSENAETQAEEETKPQTREQQMRRQLEQQRKDLNKTREEIEDKKKKLEELKDGQGFKRFRTQRQLDSQKKEAAKKQKMLAKTEGALQKHLLFKQLLNKSWFSLVPSFGAAYLYIAFHFLNAYFTPWGNLFCRFGEEWLPDFKPFNVSNNKLEWVEILGCVGLGLLLLGLVILILFGISLLVYIWMNPIKSAIVIAFEGLKYFMGIPIGVID